MSGVLPALSRVNILLILVLVKPTGNTLSNSLKHYPITIAWVKRPERQKAAKGELKCEL